MRTCKRGMTLVESVVWVAVFALTMIALISMLLYFYSTNRYTLNEAVAISSSQRVLDTVIRTIRSATYSATGAYPIVSIGPHEIIFYAQKNGTTTIQRIRYVVTGTNIQEGIIQPTGNPPVYNQSQEIITFIGNNIQNITVGTSTFQYFDTQGNAITNYQNIQDVRMVRINAVVDVSTTTAPDALMLSTSASLRNLGVQ